jgi:hypothetical protein
MAEGNEAQYRVAEEQGRALLENGPRAVEARYDLQTRRLELELANGCSYAFPVDLIQDLQGATETDLAAVEVDGLGFNLHWPALNVDLYVPAVVSGVFGTKAWMASELARHAGGKTSPAKAVAARANGLKGGRPRKLAGKG